MLAIGRALMSNPKLIVLDEPSLGLAPIITSKIFKTIREINREGVTVLLVEQKLPFARRVADRRRLEPGNVVRMRDERPAGAGPRAGAH